MRYSWLASTPVTQQRWWWIIMHLAGRLHTRVGVRRRLVWGGWRGLINRHYTKLVVSSVGWCQSTSSHGTRCCLPELQTNILTYRIRLPNGRLHSTLAQMSRWHCRWWIDCAAALQPQNTPRVVSAFFCPSDCNGGCCSQSPSKVNYSIDTVSSHYRRSWCRHQTARQGMPEASRYPRRPIPEDHWPWSCHTPDASIELHLR